MMKVALIQCNASADKTANVAKAVAAVSQAVQAKAKLIVFPEIFSFRGNVRDAKIRQEASETLTGPTVQTFATMARAHKVWIMLGSILEKGSRDKVYNTTVVLNPQGNIEQKYRKIHLFDARIDGTIIKEADCFLPGRREAIVNINGFQAGLSICYDLRFGEFYAKYRAKKVDFICAPSCFTYKTGQAHWEVLVRARAIENLAYVIAPNQVGPDSRGIMAYGSSMIVSPWGEILARGSTDKEEIVFGDVDHHSIKDARDRLPGIVG